MSEILRQQARYLPNILNRVKIQLLSEVATLATTAQTLDEETRADITEAIGYVSQAIDALQVASASMHAGSITFAAEDADERPTVPEKPSTATLLSTVIVSNGILSSSVKAKRAIRGGAITVNGEKIVNPSYILEPGSYEIGTPDGAKTVQV